MLVNPPFVVVVVVSNLYSHDSLVVVFVVVIVEFYLKPQHKQATPFIHASDMTNLIIIVMGRGGGKYHK